MQPKDSHQRLATPGPSRITPYQHLLQLEHPGTRAIQMAKEQNQPKPGNMTPPKHNYTTTAIIGYPKADETQENDPKSNLIKMIESFNDEMNKSFEQIQKNTIKQREVFKEEINKSLKDIQEHTLKQVKEMNKIVQDLKVEIEAINTHTHTHTHTHTQTEGILKMEILWKRTGSADASITNQIREMEERISDIESTIEDMDSSAKENGKAKEFPTQNIQEIWDTMK